MYTQDLLLFRRWLSPGGGVGGTRVYFLTRTRDRIALGSCTLCCSRLAFLQPQDIAYHLIVFATCFILILKEFCIDSHLCPFALCMWCIAQLCCRTDINRASFLADFAVLRRVWDVSGSKLMRSAIWLDHCQGGTTCDSSLKMIHNGSKHVGGIMR